MNHQFEPITGYDKVTFHLNDDIAYYGYFKESPLRERLLPTYTELAIKDEIHKHYRAHWMIMYNELLLGYVNGMFEGKKLYTGDIVPEFSGDELLHHLTSFTGTLKFVIEKIEYKTRIESEYFNSDTLNLHFKEGNLNGIIRTDVNY